MKYVQAATLSRCLAFALALTVPFGPGDVARAHSTSSLATSSADDREEPESAGPLIEGYCYGSPTTCPCGNATGADEGCMNSFGIGGKLVGSGIARVSNDTIALTVSHLPTTAATVLFQGWTPSNAGSGAVFGDGLRCADTNVWRLISRNASAGGFSFGSGAGTAKVSVKGHLPINGGTRFYQAWYRNSAAFCTSQSINLTNGVKIVWAP